jgi:hypothetical protein
MGVLRDIGADFERGADPCGAEKPEQGPQLGWLCTLPRGHIGSHIAHDLDGTVITKWP